MSHTRLFVAATIIAIIILAGFALSVPHTRDLPESYLSNIATTSESSVSLRDVFKKGTHTITGSIEAPTPCTEISTEALLNNASSSAKSILVKIIMLEDAGVCLKRPTTIRFGATIDAPASLPLSVTVNGNAATITDL
ncbi:MAG: hypothetical protein WAW90_02400 [Minisyncoccia bacterium]